MSKHLVKTILTCLARSQRDRHVARPSRRKLLLEALEDRVVLDDNSAGPFGINARATGLTGQGVHIGQIENGRPGLRGAMTDNDQNSHSHVTPAEVFLRDVSPPVWNQDVDTDQFHATKMAGIMVANGPTNRGVAPNAILHASAWREANSTDYETMLVTAQHIARRENDNIPVINMSASFDPRNGDTLRAFGNNDGIESVWHARSCSVSWREAPEPEVCHETARYR